MVFFVAVSAAYGGTCAGAEATGMPMGEGSTVTGHVYVRAAVEEGYQADISVILAADFEGGTAHEYHLNPGNGYGVSDDIEEGSYICVPYITDPEQDGTVYVEYGGGEKSVTREQDTAFVVVAGSAGFVKSYLWISGLRDMEGGYLKGEISREQAEEAFQETVAGQRELQEEALDPAGSAPEDADTAEAAGPRACTGGGGGKHGEQRKRRDAHGRLPDSRGDSMPCGIRGGLVCQEKALSTYRIQRDGCRTDSTT